MQRIILTDDDVEIIIMALLAIKEFRLADYVQNNKLYVGETTRGEDEQTKED